MAFVGYLSRTRRIRWKLYFQRDGSCSKRVLSPQRMIPVCSSGLAVGVTTTLLMTRVTRSFLRTCGLLMALQAAVGLLGFVLHLRADLYRVGPSFLDRVIYGAPIFAPLLFPDLVVLACIGLWVTLRQVAETRMNRFFFTKVMALGFPTFE